MKKKNPNLKTIKFTGWLKKKYGPGATLVGANMKQLMSGLVHRFGPEFKEDIRTNDWHLIKGKLKDGNDIGEDELEYNFRDNVLHLVPVVAGASAGFRIIVGIVLIVVGVFTSWAGGQYLIMMGASLALGGVVELLTKQAKPNTSQQDEKAGYVYNGISNVTNQGGPVPLAYGRFRCSSVIISTDTTSEDILLNDSPSNGWIHNFLP